MADQSHSGECRGGVLDEAFGPSDFWEVFANLPEDCPLIGGQAVALWAERYGLRGEKGEAITSADIDFWGERKDLIAVAKALRYRAVFPHEYEMTVWVGAIPWAIDGKKTLVEFLHTVPGLDTNDPAKASVERQYEAKSVKKIIPVLSPVSLVLAKLHCLRHFNQDEREDELHLRICLEASRQFLVELLEQHEVRQVLWNCERLIAASRLKPYRRLEREHGFAIKSAIPIEGIWSAARNKRYSKEDRSRLESFTAERWKRLAGKRKLIT